MGNGKRNDQQAADFEDYLDSVEMKNWFEKAGRDLFPKLEASRMCVLTFDGMPDPRACLELGAMIYFGRPIVLISTRRYPLPERLRNLADVVVEADDFTSPETGAKIQEAVESVMARLREKK